MSSRRFATAIVSLALAAGPVAAQITESVTPPTNSAVAEPATTAAQSDAPSIQASPVPEPGTILLVAGPAALGWVAYWRRKWHVEPAKPNGDVTI